jgi:hypothetical protein
VPLRMFFAIRYFSNKKLDACRTHALMSKLITCFIDGFNSGMKSQSIAYLLIEGALYIGFQTLKVKCTQYGICSQAAFKNVMTMFFSKLGGTCNNFRSGSNILNSTLRDCFNPDLAPPESSGGVCLTSTMNYLDSLDVFGVDQ